MRRFFCSVGIVGSMIVPHAVLGESTGACKLSPSAKELRSVMVMHQPYAPISGEWHELEGESRWIGKTASVLLRSGLTSQAVLMVESYLPPQQLIANGPVTLTILINDQYFDSLIFDTSNKYYYKALLPQALSSSKTLCVTLSVNKSHHAPGDLRELGLLLQRISVEKTSDRITPSTQE
jgi:hypothetical protein